MVEGLGEFSQNELAITGDFGDNDAGTIAPVVFAGLGRTGRDGVTSGRARCNRLIVFAFTPETAIGIAGRLFGFVEAVSNVGLGIVFLHPGDDVFGIERDAVTPRNTTCGEFSTNEFDTVSEEELQRRIRQMAEHPGEVSLSGQTGKGIETQRRIRRRDEWKTKQGYESGMFDEVFR